MDINYDELFGLEAAETTDNPTAETAAQPETEPAQPEAQPEEKPETQPEEKPAEKTAEPTEEQTREERSRQAMARRLREAEERAAKAATKAAEERFSAMLARNGVEDTDTNETLDSYEKFAAYDQKKSDERLRNGRANAEDIRRVIREEREEREKESQPPQPQVDPQVQAQLEQIRRMDPEMTDIGKILESDIGQAFRGFVGAGDDFVTAFFKARTQQAQIPAKAAEAAKQKAAGKEHLGKTQSLGTEEIPVPRDEMAQFRIFFPDANEAEIRKYYNADRKKYGPK